LVVCQTKQMSLSTIGQDSLALVFDNLSDFDILVLKRVCKQFSQVIKSHFRITQLRVWSYSMTPLGEATDYRRLFACAAVERKEIGERTKVVVKFRYFEDVKTIDESDYSMNNLQTTRMGITCVHPLDICHNCTGSCLASDWLGQQNFDVIENDTATEPFRFLFELAELGSSEPEICIHLKRWEIHPKPYDPVGIVRHFTGSAYRNGISYEWKFFFHCLETYATRYQLEHGRFSGGLKSTLSDIWVTRKRVKQLVISS